LDWKSNLFKLKLVALLLFFCSTTTFGQLDLSKSEVEINLNKPTFNQEIIENLLFEFKILNKHLDTLKIGYDEKNVAKKIIVNNKTLGVLDQGFHALIKLFDPDFRATDKYKDFNSDYFYDSFSKHLIQVKYNSAPKRKNIEIVFLSDAEKVKQFLSKISHK
jgi:hypothetical protein